MATVTNNNVFPVDALEGSTTALVLFAAAFGGRQDAWFIADAGMRATCVDIQLKPLLEMRHKFPEHWDFVVFDAYDFPQHTRKLWDVVTADVATNDFDRAAAMIEDWCGLARRTVILGTGEHTQLEVPEGWKLVERLHRSDYAGGVYWAVLQRA